MKKFTKLILGAVFSVGCLFAFAGCGNQQVSDLQDQVSDLQGQISDLQGQISDLRENFTGSPKFNYDSIDEPISYYIQGTKIFDFTITNIRGATFVDYTVEFHPAFTVDLTTNNPFTAKLYDPDKQTIYSDSAGGADIGKTFFFWESSDKSILVLYYYNQPFACVTLVKTNTI